MHEGRKIEVRAAGIIPFFKTKDDVEFLTLKYIDDTYKCNELIQFPGGKIEFKDIKIGQTDKIYEEKQSIKNTAFREMEEESNGVLNKYISIENLDFKKTHYVPESKYLFFLVEVDEKIDIKKFGDHEIVDTETKWKRDFLWINIEDARKLMENQKKIYFDGIFNFLKNPNFNSLFTLEQKKDVGYRKFGFINLNKVKQNNI